VLAFRREPGFACLANLSGAPVPLIEHDRVLLASGPLTEDGQLPPDTAVWLRT
jgi:alpha-glucosidase